MKKWSCSLTRFGLLAPLSLTAMTGCDIIVNIGDYCVVGKDEGCGTGGSGATGSSNGGGGTGGATGSTGTSTSGGTGGSPQCSPDDLPIDCYEGPDGTVNVGICKGGKSTCQQDGTWGICEGQVTPGVETCASTDDEDCDDKECASWALVLGDSQLQSVLDVAFTSAGDILVLASFTGTITVGGTSHTAVSGTDLLLLKLNSAGELLWLKTFEVSGAVLALDGADNIFIAGNLQDTVDFGCNGPLTNTNGATSDIFVTKLGSTGNCIWNKRYGDAEDQTLEDMAVNPLGDVFITGSYKGTLNFGVGNLTAPGTAFDAYAAKLGSGGPAIWSKRYGDTLHQTGKKIAVDQNNHVLVGGTFAGTVNFGLGDVTDASPNAADLYALTLLANDGSTQGVKTWNVSSPALWYGLEYDAMGDWLMSVAFLGSFEGYTTAGLEDIFVGKFASSGDPIWKRQFGGGSSDESLTMAILNDGAVVVAASSNGGVDFGGGPLQSAGLYDLFVAKLDSSGDHIWSRAFGDASMQNNPRIAVNDAGESVLGATVSGVFAIGKENVASAGSDILIAKLAP